MNSFALLGPNYVDQVFHPKVELSLDLTNFGDWTTSLGGIFNVARHLHAEGMTAIEISVADRLLTQKSRAPELAKYTIVRVDDSFVVEVVVVEDATSGTRTSLVDNRLVPVDATEAIAFESSDFLHISYLDAIKMNLELQRNLRDRFRFISCDLASADLQEWVVDSLWMADALICSASEFKALIQSPKIQSGLVSLPKTTCVHDPEFLLFMTDEHVERVEQPKFRIANTLGAGDAFVATFLARISQGSSALEAAKLANLATRQLLLSRGGKN
jgi:sugar/nucleoside kinase (ribokinase family)